MKDMPFFNPSLSEREDQMFAVDLDNPHGSACLDSKEIELKNEFHNYLTANGYRPNKINVYKGLIYNMRHNPDFKTNSNAYAILIRHLKYATKGPDSGDWTYPLLLRVFFETVEEQCIRPYSKNIPASKYAALITKSMSDFNLSEIVSFYNISRINTLLNSTYINEKALCKLNASVNIEDLIRTQCSYLDSGKYSKVFKSSQYKEYLYYSWSVQNAADIFTKDLSNIIKTGFYKSYKQIAWNVTALDDKLLTFLNKKEEYSSTEREYLLSAYLRNERIFADKNMESTALIRSRNNMTYAGIMLEQNINQGITKIKSLQALDLSDIQIVHSFCADKLDKEQYVSLPEIGYI